MTQPLLQDLLEAGVHFGHQTRRWNPKMRRFIFAERSGIYLIDLQKTLTQLHTAQDLLRGVVVKGEGVLFVCTKKQLKQVVKAEAERCGAYSVTERWLGGTLTNFQTIKKQIRRLKDIEQAQDEGGYEFFTKKEQLLITREREKLNRYLDGIKRMGRLPGAILMNWTPMPCARWGSCGSNSRTHATRPVPPSRGGPCTSEISKPSTVPTGNGVQLARKMPPRVTLGAKRWTKVLSSG